MRTLLGASVNSLSIHRTDESRHQFLFRVREMHTSTSHHVWSLTFSRRLHQTRRSHLSSCSAFHFLHDSTRRPPKTTVGGSQLLQTFSQQKPLRHSRHNIACWKASTRECRGCAVVTGSDSWSPDPQRLPQGGNAKT